MPVRNSFCFSVAALSISFLLLVPKPALAYIGPGSGLEFLPYFFSLLGFAGLAFGSILLRPIRAVLRRFRKPKEEPTTELTTEPTVAVPEPQGEVSHNNP